jgi:hypothetical protein
VVVELKSGKFKPEYAGKLNFYLSAIDSQLRHEQDHPSVGLVLCKYKDKVEAEYSLRDIHKPIGISEYKLTQTLPKNFKSQLPTVQEIETQFELKAPVKTAQKSIKQKVATKKSIKLKK